MTDENFWVWFAGFWEGEGSFIQTKDGRFAIHIAQQGKRGEKIIREIESNISFGHVTSHLNPKKDNHVWDWHTAIKKNILIVMENILPYLRFRKSEVSDKLEKLRKWEYKRNHWTKNQLKLLKEKGSIITDTKLSEIMNFKHPRKSIAIKRLELGIKKDLDSIRDDWWTAEEENLLKNYYPFYPVKRFRKFIPRHSSNAIKVKSSRMGILKRR